MRPILTTRRGDSAFTELIRDSWLGRGISRHLSIILLLLLLLGEACLALFVVRDLGRSYASVEKMYNGSVQGLLRIGDMQYDAQETRRSTLYALTTSDGNLQVTYADQSRAADRGVTQGIAQCLAEAQTPEEVQAGHQLEKDWSDYLKVRDEVLGLILEGSIKEAVQLDIKSSVLEFDRVRRDLNDVKRSYDAQASQQLATVAALSRSSMQRLTAALAFGLIFGMAAIWGIQRSRVRSAMQFAKLQMDFVASVSHELKTPLTAIMTAGENIRDGLAYTPDSLCEQGSVITDQSHQLMELVDQVLQFSATREAKLSHALRELRVNEVIEHALRATRSVVEQAGFSVESTVDPDLPPVIGDLSLLSQCIQNLIVNAIKYSPAKRWVGIAAHMDREEQAVLVSVRDRGIGIGAEDVSRIFDPFYRSPRVIAARIDGTGLGLSIAKRTVEVLGGDLTVSTELGVGSIFTIHLPVARDVAAEGIEPPSAVRGGEYERKHLAH